MSDVRDITTLAEFLVHAERRLEAGSLRVDEEHELLLTALSWLRRSRWADVDPPQSSELQPGERVWVDNGSGPGHYSTQPQQT